jgi:IS30 family transposase
LEFSDQLSKTAFLLLASTGMHFDSGLTATRIAELMKVDRNTINNDLKILYRKDAKDYHSDKSYERIEKRVCRVTRNSNIL